MSARLHRSPRASILSAVRRTAGSYASRDEAGTLLAAELADERGPDTVVIGLARGGVAVAAAVARQLRAPLDALAVRKIGHPLQSEYGIGAVTVDDTVFVRDREDLSRERLRSVTDRALRQCQDLDERIHRQLDRVGVQGRSVLLVDDGLATGGTMMVAARWARAAGARRVVVAVPVGSPRTLDWFEDKVDRVVCPNRPVSFLAVGQWYRDFDEVATDQVIELLRQARLTPPPPPPPPPNPAPST